MAGKNGRHGSAFPVGVSISPIASQRRSGRGPRERSPPNANRRVSKKAKAAAAVDLGPGVLDYPPQPMGRLAQAVALRPARYSCAMAARAVPEILGQVVQAAAPGPRSPTHRRRTPPLDRTNGRRQSTVARTQDSWRTQEARYRHFRAYCLTSPTHAPTPAAPDL